MDKEVRLEATKERIILVNVEPLEKVETNGFLVKNGETQKVGTVYSAPESCSDIFKEGDRVLLRSKSIPETTNIGGIEYTFSLPMDILCKIL